jgi:hypothetical protein
MSAPRGARLVSAESFGGAGIMIPALGTWKGACLTIATLIRYC